ncbi:DUF488 family protein, N3 subclade [Phyllobacterium sp. P5_D12]
MKLKRSYEAAAAEDGTRVPVHRLWPRGVSKKDAALTLGMKEIASSTSSANGTVMILIAGTRFANNATQVRFLRKILRNSRTASSRLKILALHSLSPKRFIAPGHFTQHGIVRFC